MSLKLACRQDIIIPKDYTGMVPRSGINVKHDEIPGHCYGKGNMDIVRQRGKSSL